jgi:hypothetical protein
VSEKDQVSEAREKQNEGGPGRGSGGVDYDEYVRTKDNAEIPKSNRKDRNLNGTVTYHKTGTRHCWKISSQMNTRMCREIENLRSTKILRRAEKHP